MNPKNVKQNVARVCKTCNQLLEPDKYYNAYQNICKDCLIHKVTLSRYNKVIEWLVRTRGYSKSTLSLLQSKGYPISTKQIDLDKLRAVLKYTRPNGKVKYNVQTTCGKITCIDHTEQKTYEFIKYPTDKNMNQLVALTAHFRTKLIQPMFQVVVVFYGDFIVKDNHKKEMFRHHVHFLQQYYGIEVILDVKGQN